MYATVTYVWYNSRVCTFFYTVFFILIYTLPKGYNCGSLLCFSLYLNTTNNTVREWTQQRRDG